MEHRLGLGTIKSSNRAIAFAALLFAGFWNLITFPLAAFIVPQGLRDGQTAVLLALLFPAVGLGLAAWAVVAVVRWRKYGDSLFEMASVPGVLGGPLAGVIRTKARLRPEDGVNLTLNCIRRWSTGTGKNRSTEERILWQDTRTIQRDALKLDMAETAIPVQFAILTLNRPTTTHPATHPLASRRRGHAGTSISAPVEVPVFHTLESRADSPPTARHRDGEDSFDLDRELRPQAYFTRPGVWRTALRFHHGPPKGAAAC